MTEPTGALLLMAAGASRRMQQPKQLLPVGGQPLLRRMVANLCAAPLRPFVVVLGAHQAAIRESLQGLPVELRVNPDWSEGLGASIRAGMRELTRAAPDIPWVVIALADQPEVSVGHLGALRAERERTGRGIVATQCDGVLMPPMLFAARYFPALGQLQGDLGARAVVSAHRDDLAVVKVTGWSDLDTPADFAKFVAGERPGP